MPGLETRSITCGIRLAMVQKSTWMSITLLLFNGGISLMLIQSKIKLSWLTKIICERLGFTDKEG
jgi:hypothetical protein